MSRAAWIALAVVVMVGIAAVAVLSGGQPAPGLIDNSQLKSLQSKGVRVVDVRTAAEFAGGHIEGAENVPLDGLANAAKGWDPQSPIALYCATGSRSAEAAQELSSLGFETVYDLSGGIVQWNGKLAGGSGTGLPAAAVPSASGLPVMYEFYTDW